MADVERHGRTHPIVFSERSANASTSRTCPPCGRREGPRDATWWRALGTKRPRARHAAHELLLRSLSLHRRELLKTRASIGSGPALRRCARRDLGQHPPLCPDWAVELLVLAEASGLNDDATQRAGRRGQGGPRSVVRARLPLPTLLLLCRLRRRQRLRNGPWSGLAELRMSVASILPTTRCQPMPRHRAPNRAIQPQLVPRGGGWRRRRLRLPEKCSKLKHWRSQLHLMLAREWQARRLEEPAKHRLAF